MYGVRDQMQFYTSEQIDLVVEINRKGCQIKYVFNANWNSQTLK